MKRILLISLLLALGAGVLAAREAESVRLMTYNIRNARGMDDVQDVGRVAAVINRCAPDIVAVQEIDSATVRSGGRFVLAELAAATGMNYVFAPAISFQGGKYGIGILSKSKHYSSRIIPLPGREESRVLLIVDYGEYVVACTHFSLTKEDRISSVRIVEKEAASCRKPFFLLGDLNCSPDSEEQKMLGHRFELLSDPAQNTYPPDNPTDCIDYIYGFTANGIQYKSVSSTVIKEAKIESDHLPVLVEANYRNKRDMKDKEARDFERQEYEKKVVRTMIEMYCSGQKHSVSDPQKVLCSDCEKLATYCDRKVDNCPLGADKTTCQDCKIHCYSAQAREQIRQVMKYAGPRMMFKHPVMAIKHLMNRKKDRSESDTAVRQAAKVKS